MTAESEDEVKPRPLRVGYPYYEDVLWEAELARKRGGPCKKRKMKIRRSLCGGGL